MFVLLVSTSSWFCRAENVMPKKKEKKNNQEKPAASCQGHFTSLSSAEGSSGLKRPDPSRGTFRGAQTPALLTATLVWARAPR